MKDDPGIKRPVSENAEAGDEDPRDLSYSVVGAAIEVHNAIGRGMSEFQVPGSWFLVSRCPGE